MPYSRAKKEGSEGRGTTYLKIFLSSAAVCEFTLHYTTNKESKDLQRCIPYLGYLFGMLNTY